MLSAAKNSTLAPAGMSEDAILQAGDQTAAVPATLIRDRPNNNNPPNGTQIETKHQLIINNVVWIAIKENVTFNRPPPPAAPVLTNGQLSSSYPTNMNVIPPDPVHPAQDAEGFSTIP
ncbi:MAG: hypothetical protein DWQ04_21645 [Chloroflexi bacterium]|nr:MAG: hypothetical protein DWQ04_21645 [Chloroflexota bacterium]